MPDDAAQAWQCFCDCSSDRHVGMAAGPIPWSSIDAWARRHAIDEPDDFDELVELVRVVDGEWMKHQGEQRQHSEQSRAGPKTTGDVPRR